MSRAQRSQRRNLAARMGRWSASHWKKATLGWLAFVFVAFALGSMSGLTQVDQNTPGPGESGRMQKILDDGFKQPAGESVLIQSRSARVGDAAFTAAIRDVIERVSKVAVVKNVRAPLAPAPARRCAQHRHFRRAAGLGEQSKSGRLAGARGTDDADHAIAPGRGPVHEHALLAREVGP